MPVSQINSYRQVGKPSLLARSTPHKDVLCSAASHIFHPAMRGNVYTRTGTHTLRSLTQQLLPTEKEGQSFFTWPSKLRLSLAPPQEGSGSRGVATAWPQMLFQLRRGELEVFVCFLPLTFCLDNRAGDMGWLLLVRFFGCFQKSWNGRRSIPCYSTK